MRCSYCWIDDVFTDGSKKNSRKKDKRVYSQLTEEVEVGGSRTEGVFFNKELLNFFLDHLQKKAHCHLGWKSP